MLRLNGYSTAQFGKCHEVPTWEMSPMGPFDRWPTGNGFEYFYGFLGGETNQFYPSLVEGTTPVRPDRTPEEGYHFTEDLAERACRWLGQQRSLAPTSRSSSTSHLAPRTPRSTCPKGGATVTGASSTRGGTSYGSRPSPARRSSASSHATVS